MFYVDEFSLHWPLYIELEFTRIIYTKGDIVCLYYPIILRSYFERNDTNSRDRYTLRSNVLGVKSHKIGNNKTNA